MVMRLENRRLYIRMCSRPAYEINQTVMNYIHDVVWGVKKAYGIDVVRMMRVMWLSDFLDEKLPIF